jgi:hypothetical protein
VQLRAVHFLRPPAGDQGGGAVPVPVHVAFLTDTAVVMAEAKRQKAALLHTGMPVGDICQSAGMSERRVLRYKKSLEEMETT